MSALHYDKALREREYKAARQRKYYSDLFDKLKEMERICDEIRFMIRGTTVPDASMGYHTGKTFHGELDDARTGCKNMLYAIESRMDCCKYDV